MGGITRRAVVRGAAALVAGAPGLSRAQGARSLDDASRLNRVAIVKHWRSAAADAELVAGLRRELAEAADAGRPVALGAARHSMGGQALPRDGTAIALDAQACAPDPPARRYRVAAGMRWSQVVRALDAVGFSPAVMQSNSDFGVAASASVNAHGWPVPFGPVGETVRQLRVMLADGTVLTCSRAEDSALFKMIIGGYGLHAIVLEAELDMVENALLEPSHDVLPADALGAAMLARLDGDARARMAYGRMSLARDAFLAEAVLVVYRTVDAPGALPPASDEGGIGFVSRTIFRAQTGSDLGKRLRWRAERAIAPARATRNTLLSEPVAAYASRERTRVDILHEYFVPPQHFAEFLAACRAVIPGSGQDLLNVTIRYVAADTTSVLAYAPAPRLAAVMLFVQPLTLEADLAMRRMTEQLIERVLALGGSFYLPYRLHARPSQVAQAYPRLPEFLAAKRRHDPRLLFRNLMWEHYFADMAAHR